MIGGLGASAQPGSDTQVMAPNQGPDVYKDIGLSALTSPQEAAARTTALPATIDTVGGMVGRAPVRLPLMAAKALGVPGAASALAYADKAYSTPSAADTALQNADSLPVVKNAINSALNKVVPGRDATDSIFYDPKTALGHVAQEGLTSAFMGAPTETAISGLVGGTAGEAGRQVFKDTPLEIPADLLLSAAGGLATPAARVAGVVSKPGDILQRALEGTVPEAGPQWGVAAQRARIAAAKAPGAAYDQFDQAQNLIDQSRDLGVPLTGPEALQQVQGGPTRLGALQRQVEMAPGGEGVMRPFTQARPGQVQQAGEGLLTDTFGPATAPESAADAGTQAAQGAIGQALANRTEAAKPAFEATEGKTVPSLAGLQELKDETNREIANAGEATARGKALMDFRKQLDQGAPPPSTDFQNQLKTAGVQPGTSAWDQAMAQATPAGAAAQPLGPLMSTNREFARRLQQKYNPTLPAEQQTGFAAEIGAKVGPLNSKLTDILRNASPDYATGLDLHAANSPEVNRLVGGPVGRIADKDSGVVGSRLGAQASEFLSPTADPAMIQKTVADMAAGERANAEAALIKKGVTRNSPEFTTAMQNFEPTATRQVVGARLKSLFDDATTKLQSGPNPWGGAKFVTETMGNPAARQNLMTTIKTLPDGDRLWAGWTKFANVMEATGKRLPRGSDTALNMGVQHELQQTASLPARIISSPLEVGRELLESHAMRANSTSLASIFVDPQSAMKMKQLAILNPASRRAQALAAEIMATTDTADRGQNEPVAAPVPPVAPPAPSQQDQQQMEKMMDTGAAKPVSATQRDLLIRTMYGEARGENPAGQAAVAYSIVNRANQRGQGIDQVVLAPHQYEPWNTPEGRQNLKSLSPNSPTYQKLGQVADAVLSGQIADPTNGATHFIAPTAQHNLGRTMPSWAKNPVAQVGNHLFYSPDKG